MTGDVEVLPLSVASSGYFLQCSFPSRLETGNYKVGGGVYQKCTVATSLGSSVQFSSLASSLVLLFISAKAFSPTYKLRCIF